MDDPRSISFWLDSVPDDLTPGPALESDIDVDVAIVGAGYTGLWTAYYLAKADPSLRMAVLERAIAGFGASGRNGGWCSALFAASRDKIAKQRGRRAAVDMQRAMFETVDEVGQVCEIEGIDADFVKGGTLTLATSPAHVGRIRGEVKEDRAWGFTEADHRWLDASEVADRLVVADCLGAAYTPHCAALHPAACLVRGLADVVKRLGVAVYENSEVTGLEPGLVRTARGRVRAGTIVQATEAYTVDLPRSRRRLMPLYSLMIATEPLTEQTWSEINWSGRETFTDGRHLLIYAERTMDDRIAIGGRGAPYHFGSRIEPGFDRVPEVFDELQRVLATLFPAAATAQITHRWGGPIGVPRDWFSSVSFDRRTRIGWAGGYVGDGVSTTNLAGRTLRDLILGADTSLTRLPWVNHRSRRWEPEPFRWIGTNLALRAMASADRKEARTGRPSRRAELLKRTIGL